MKTAFSKISGKFTDFLLLIKESTYFVISIGICIFSPFSGVLEVLCCISILLLLCFNRHTRVFFSNHTVRLINIYITEKNLNVLLLPSSPSPCPPAISSSDQAQLRFSFAFLYKFFSIIIWWRFTIFFAHCLLHATSTK